MTKWPRVRWGNAWVEKAERERERYFTAATGKETGELASARARFVEAKRRSRRRRRSARRPTAQPTSWRRWSSSWEELDKRIAAQRARVHDAKTRADRAGEIAAQLKAQAGEVERTRMQSDLAAAALAKRNELALTLAQLAGRIEDDTTTLRSMRTAHSVLVDA